MLFDHRPEVAKSRHLFNCFAVDGYVKRLERVGRMGLCQDIRLSNIDLQAALSYASTKASVVS